ncbi:hypothetical protein Syun_021622 [Stephania yunnanensis]|uniref:FAD/NAD(P)-binding domain-containing protein n=1 Tax=Stephania yunnanensis TaxID=152371 RepID=A0AAP0IGQ7_9MAGN
MAFDQLAGGEKVAVLIGAQSCGAFLPKSLQFHENVVLIDPTKKIKSVDSILIIGGGPTGVELAGEIVTDFPEKKVTVVHRGSRLLGFIGAKASKKTLDWFVAKQIEDHPRRQETDSDVAESELQNNGHQNSRTSKSTTDS